MHAIIRTTILILFSTLVSSSVYASTGGLSAIVSLAKFVLATYVALFVLLLIWLAVNWSNKATQQMLFFRTFIDTVIIIFGSFCLWVWGALAYKASYGNGLWRALADGYYFFYNIRLLLLAILIMLLAYLLNSWLSSSLRVLRYPLHLFICLLMSMGILMLFDSKISGPATKWFVNAAEVSKIDDPFDYIRWSDYYGIVIDHNSAVSHPKITLAYANRGDKFFKEGQYESAISDYTKAIEADPNSVIGYKKLSWLLSTCIDGRYRDGMRALDITEKAIKLRECRNIKLKDSLVASCADLFNVLSAAYAEVNRFEEATTTQEIAILRLKETRYTSLSYIYTSRLESYKDHKPWREKVVDLHDLPVSGFD